MRLSLEALLDSTYTTRSVLVTTAHLDRVAPLVPGEVPVYALPPRAIEAVTGEIASAVIGGAMHRRHCYVHGVRCLGVDRRPTLYGGRRINQLNTGIPYRYRHGGSRC